MPIRRASVLGLLQLARGQALGDRRHGEGRIAQGKLGGLGDDRAVDPAREGDGHPAVSLQGCEQPLATDVQVGVVVARAQVAPPKRDSQPLRSR